jgi:hypothetical protein
MAPCRVAVYRIPVSGSSAKAFSAVAGAPQPSKLHGDFAGVSTRQLGYLDACARLT